MGSASNSRPGKISKMVRKCSEFSTFIATTQHLFCIILLTQNSYEMFVEMDKMDGEMDVKIKKKKVKKKEKLESMKKEMDIVC